MTNTLGIMLEILNSYPWTRLAVRIIRVINRQFFHMVTHVFDNSNLSQEIFAVDTWRAVTCSLGHGRNHMLTILPTRYGDQAQGKSAIAEAGEFEPMFTNTEVHKIVRVSKTNKDNPSL